MELCIKCLVGFSCRTRIKGHFFLLVKLQPLPGWNPAKDLWGQIHKEWTAASFATTLHSWCSGLSRRVMQCRHKCRPPIWHLHQGRKLRSHLRCSVTCHIHISKYGYWMCVREENEKSAGCPHSKRSEACCKIAKKHEKKTTSATLRKQNGNWCPKPFASAVTYAAVNWGKSSVVLCEIE